MIIICLQRIERKNENIMIVNNYVGEKEQVNNDRYINTHTGTPTHTCTFPHILTHAHT